MKNGAAVVSYISMSRPVNSKFDRAHARGRHLNVEPAGPAFGEQPGNIDILVINLYRDLAPNMPGRRNDSDEPVDVIVYVDSAAAVVGAGSTPTVRLLAPLKPVIINVVPLLAVVVSPVNLIPMPGFRASDHRIATAKRQCRCGVIGRHGGQVGIA